MESGIQGIFHVPAGSSCAVNHIPAQQGLPAEEYNTAGGLPFPGCQKSRLFGSLRRHIVLLVTLIAVSAGQVAGIGQVKRHMHQITPCPFSQSRKSRTWARSSSSDFALALASCSSLAPSQSKAFPCSSAFAMASYAPSISTSLHGS